jgi:two-component system, cell cycle sensor histidine kinase and response regulator CckA
VNPAYEQMTGYPRKEVIGRKRGLLNMECDDRSVAMGLPAGLSQGDPWSGHLVKKRKDGTLYEADATISPVRDPNGTITHYVMVKRDVTQEVMLQQQLLQSQKMEAIGTLAGGIAHDFNNLLQVTLGYSELLLADKSEDDPECADLQRIVQAARSGAELVQRLLAFSRKLEPRLESVNLNKQIVKVEKLLQRTIPKMIDIQLDLDQDLANVKADPAQMEQVLVNLALNARDAMPEGGLLAVRTSSVFLEDDYCRLHAEATPGRNVLLSVSDTGHGMSRDTLDHIFEPFFTTKELGRGTGLGLAMVYGIVNQHGGHITAHSEPGSGSEFKIYLPSVEISLEAAGEVPTDEPEFGTETILLVDDEQFVRELGERILTNAGYTVLGAGDGLDAREVFRREKDRISLVILDLVMPSMGGQECLKELRKIDPEVKILIASGYAGDTELPESLTADSVGFVSKPFRIRELLRQVRRALDKS